MARHKRVFSSLRDLYRHASYRRFRARHREQERFTEVLGFGPTGQMVGWLEGSDDLLELDPDATDWSESTYYV